MGDLWQDLAHEVIMLIGTFRSKLTTLAISSKPDHTLLTEADINVQDLIVRRIREFDPKSRIIAEEHSALVDNSQPAESEDVWVIDPIDGTAQFVRPEAVEFCNVVALYNNGRPAAALVIAPEFGHDRSPVVISAALTESLVTVNQQPIRTVAPRELTGNASTTRSRNSQPSLVEERLLARHYSLKTRTTSQTLDMVRTALDLSAFSPHGRPFDLFHRRDQKLWDGAAGMCLALAAGLTVRTEQGDEILPLSPSLLAATPPVLASSLVGHPALIDEVLG